MMVNKRDDIVALHLEMWLTPDCHVNLTVNGKITPLAIRRLVALVELTAVPDSDNGESGEVKSKTND